MFLRSLDHYNIETVQLAETVGFYADVLGMTLGDRPAMDIPGAWLCAGGHPCIHVNEVAERRDGPTGPIDHVAFEADGYEAMTSRLEASGIAFETVDSRPRLPLRQVYVRDPNGIRIELNFRGLGDAERAETAGP